MRGFLCPYFPACLAGKWWVSWRGSYYYVKHIQCQKNFVNFIEFTGSKKIILTTDQDLIKDGVQAIEDEFLQWFVKNPSCEWVEVGYGWIRFTETDNEGYWVSIPDKQFEMQQEEPKKQIIYNKEDLKQSYSQGWMTRERFDDLSPDIIYPDGLDYEEKQEYAFNLWFEQFKNK